MPMERHYRVKELADLWGFSRNTIIKRFANEPGVIKLTSSSSRRTYATLSIPESVAFRVHESLSNKTLQPTLPSRNPLRVVTLGDFHRRVAKKSRNVADSEAA